MTELDDELIPEVVSLLDDLGKAVTFRTYPSRTVNESTSEVTLGTPTDYSVKVSPPYQAMRKITEDGRAVQVEVSRIIVPTGSGTADALAFTPELNQPVLYDGKTGYIVGLDSIYSGDLIAAYQVDLDI